MKILIAVLILTSATPEVLNAQGSSLQSTKHGLDMMLRDVPKEMLIAEIRFKEGRDDTVGVARLDYVGPSLYPLIISSKRPVPADSLGLLSFTLPKDTLYNFLEMIDNVNPKIYSRKKDFVLIRITYRFRGHLFQYYETNAIITTGFFKLIEHKLLTNGDPSALEKFYKFVAPTGLIVGIHGKRVWKYQ